MRLRWPQRTKSWCLKHIANSPNRVAALGKFLVATSKVQTPDEDAVQKPAATHAAPWQRRRLHVLYVLNDLLHHTKNHEADQSAHIRFTTALQPHLVDAVTLAASAETNKAPEILAKIQDLLSLWADEGYYSVSYVGRLRESAENAAGSGTVGTNPEGPAVNGSSASTATVSTRLPKEAPFVMPASHGDMSTPFHDLPAANMMPYIVPNSTAPIATQLMKPLQFVAGPAEAALATAVKDFLGDANSIYDPIVAFQEDEGIVADIDDMGQTIRKEEETGEVLNGETYYGWSRDFCERMKKRRRRREGPPNENKQNGRTRSASSSRSRRLSDSSRKRRRFSESRSRSRSRSPIRSRSRSGLDRSRRRDSSDSASRSPRSRSRHVLPRVFDDRGGRNYTSHLQDPRPPPEPSSSGPPGPPTSSPFNPTFPPPFGVGPDGMPLPPPRPAGWQGPWPPPPPPPQGLPGMPALPMQQNPPFLPQMPVSNMIMGMPTNMQMGMEFAMQGGQSSPPSPPPPPQSSPPASSTGWQGQHYGHGRGGWGGNSYGHSRGQGR